MRIGVDIDGVVYDWVRQYRRFCMSYLGKQDLPEITEWYFYKSWGITTTEFLAHLCQNPIAIYGGGERIDGALTGLNKLQCAGHELYAVTARPFQAISVTYKWLLATGFRWNGIVINDDKSFLSTDIAIDDGPHNIEALQAAGHPRPIVFDQPWNRHVDAERVCSWPELVEAING